jgi:hypothetical protein
MSIRNYKIIKQIPKVVVYFFSMFLIGLGIFTIKIVSLPLFDLSVNEINKSQVIGMLPGVPLEFDASGANFWWLEAPRATIIYTNDSDEVISGTLNMFFEVNPCKNNKRIIVKYEQLDIIKNISDSKTNLFSVPLIINPYSDIKINIEFDNEYECELLNGDNRLFGAKLVSWSFL